VGIVSIGWEEIPAGRCEMSFRGCREEIVRKEDETMLGSVALGNDRPEEVAVLSLAGDLDISNADGAARAIRRAEAGAPAVLVLDLRRVTFVDSTMLRVIIAAHERGAEAGRRVVVAASDAVKRLFRTTLLEWRLEIVDDPARVEAGGPGAVRPRQRR
jgi:anti-anti-sigma factor